MIPTLTRSRWRALRKLKDRGNTPFTGIEVGVKGQALVSLEECEWVERVDLSEFRAVFTFGTSGNHWRLTDKGRAAIEALPETEPRI